MFDQDDCVMCLAEDRQELVCGECSLDHKGTGSTVDARKDAGEIPAHVQEHEPLQLLVAVQCCGEHIGRGNYRTERSRLERDGRAKVELHARDILRLRVIRLREWGV